MADEDTTAPLEGIFAPEVVDPESVPIVYADWLIEWGSLEGVLNCALGTVDYSMRKNGVGQPRIVTVARLRFTFPFAERLHAMLGKALEAAKEHRDGTQQPPPTNMIN